jgi:hypothetical protein
MSTTCEESGAAEGVISELSALDIKNLGQVSKILGINITLDENSCMNLSQLNQINGLYEKLKLENSKPLYLPRSPSTDEAEGDQELLKDQSLNFINIKNYQSMVGSLLWITRCTRPDIAYAVHCLTCKTHAPRKCDWESAKKVIRYLHTTKELKLKFPRTKSSTFNISAYSDADWGSSADRKSLSGCLVRVNNCPIYWYTKKQNSVSTSTMEAEFTAASLLIKDVIWLRSIFTEAKLPYNNPTIIHVDNQAAIAQLEDESSPCKAKHMDIKLKFIKQHVKDGEIKPNYVETENQLADIFTKALPKPSFNTLKEKIGLQ